MRVEGQVFANTVRALSAALSLSHAHPLSHAHTLSHSSLSHPRSLSLSLSLPHTHSHTLAREARQMQRCQPEPCETLADLGLRLSEGAAANPFLFQPR